MEKRKIIQSQSETIKDLFDQIKAGLKKREEEGRPYFPASLGLCLHSPKAAFSVGTNSVDSMSTASQRTLKPSNAGKGLTSKLAGNNGSDSRVSESTPLFSPLETPIDISYGGGLSPKSSLGKMPPVEISSSVAVASTTPSEKDIPNVSTGLDNKMVPMFPCSPYNSSHHSNRMGSPNLVQNSEKDKGKGFKSHALWDAPSFGKDIFKQQMELQDNKKRTLEQIGSDNKNKSLLDFISDDTFNGLGGGDGVSNHAYPLMCKWKTEEADAFVEFANKYIPTGPKRRRL